MLKFWSVFHIQTLWHNSTRDTSFLEAPYQSLPGKQKNPFPSTSRHINSITTLMCTFSLILNWSSANQKNSTMKRWKYRSKGLLNIIFCHQESNEKADRVSTEFSSSSNTSKQRCLNLLFQNQSPHFLATLFWKLSQSSAQDPQNGKQSHSRLPSHRLHN